MIKITVDDAYAFDYFSILELKQQKGCDVQISIDQIKKDIIENISSEKFNLIVKSEEYSKLYDANKKTFDAVDGAKTDEVLASYVDKCNYYRMICKKKLQDKHFSDKLTETKLGYEKIIKHE